MGDRVLRHLHDDRLTVAQHALDARPLAALDVGRVVDDVAAVQHAVLRRADVDERGLHPGQHVLHAAEVDVAVDRQGVVGRHRHVVLDEGAALEHGDVRDAVGALVHDHQVAAGRPALAVRTAAPRERLAVERVEQRGAVDVDVGELRAGVDVARRRRGRRPLRVALGPRRRRCAPRRRSCSGPGPRAGGDASWPAPRPSRRPGSGPRRPVGVPDAARRAGGAPGRVSPTRGFAASAAEPGSAAAPRGARADGAGSARARRRRGPARPTSSSVSPRSAGLGGPVFAAASASRARRRRRRRAGLAARGARLLAPAPTTRPAPAALLRQRRRGRSPARRRRATSTSAGRPALGHRGGRRALARSPFDAGSAPCAGNRVGDSVSAPVSERSSSDIDAFSHDARASSARGRVSASSGSNRVPSRSIH